MPTEKNDKDYTALISELKRFSKLCAGYFAFQQIEKLVTTDERKAIWFLCSGKLTREQISSESGVSLRTVTTFVDTIKTVGLVEEERDKGGHPFRVIDYCPIDWKKFLKPKTAAPQGNENSLT